MNATVTRDATVAPGASTPPDSLIDSLGETAGEVSFAGIVRSEWVKFRSVRSSWLILVSSVLAMIVLGGVVGYGRGPRTGPRSASRIRPRPVDSRATSSPRCSWPSSACSS